MPRPLRWLAQLTALAFIALALKWLLAKLAKLSAKIIDNALTGWLGEVIGRWLGISSPSEQEVIEAIAEWGPPLVLLAVGLFIYHSIYTKAWLKGQWRPRPLRWGPFAIFRRIIDRIRRPKLLGRKHVPILPPLPEERDDFTRWEKEARLDAFYARQARDRQDGVMSSQSPSSTGGRRRR